MARRDALLRLHQSLLARREHLRRKLAGELANLRDFKSGDATGDSVDVAFETGSDEMTSQLAELDARELSQIERALVKMKQGTYGVCEGCQTKIPVARLNALPYSTACVKCQREMELSGDWGETPGQHWDKVLESSEERPINLNDLEMDLSK